MRAQLTWPDAPADHPRYHATAASGYSEANQARNYRYPNVTQRAIRHARRRVLAVTCPTAAQDVVNAKVTRAKLAWNLPAPQTPVATVAW